MKTMFREAYVVYNKGKCGVTHVVMAIFLAFLHLVGQLLSCSDKRF
jgi:hypothetical protein